MSNPCKTVGVTGQECDTLKQLLAQLCPGKTKKKRKPSFYNMYVKSCIASKGGVKKFSQAGPLMKQCALEYKEDKKTSKFRYKVETPPEQTAQANPQLWKGRDLQKEWNALYKKLAG